MDLPESSLLTVLFDVPQHRGKVCYLKCQLPEALKVYSDAASLARDQREVEHIILYEKGIILKQH